MDLQHSFTQISRAARTRLPVTAVALAALAWLALGLAGLAGCARPAASLPEPAILADSPPPGTQAAVTVPPSAAGDSLALAIEGQVVSQDELRRWWEQHVAAHPVSVNQLDKERRRFFAALIDDLILARAARDAGAEKDPEFQERLRPVYLSLLAAFFKERYVFPDVTVSPEEVVAYYTAHPDEFESPPTISVRFILTSTRNRAMEALDAIQAGRSFETVARQFSTHPSALSGGVLPPFAKGAYDPDFERVAWSLQVGEMSGVVNTSIGYCIIEKTGQTNAIAIPLIEAQPDIEAKLLKQKQNQRLEEFVNMKRASYNIYINPRAYDVMTAPNPTPAP